MKKNTIRIATRKSPLALWQAEFVKQKLEKAHSNLIVEISGFLTQGDKWLATPLAQIGGKALFVKELEKMIMERRADIAVHSIKDIPAEFPDGLILSTICERDDPRDAFVSNNYKKLKDLPKGAVVGTSSMRRQSQLLHLRPDLKVESIRGSVGTRLNKLDEEKYDAIILAAVGLKRLGETKRIRHYFDVDEMLPAVGQGAIGIECHADDQDTRALLDPLDHHDTRACVTAERTMNKQLGGSCQVPIGSHAIIKNKQLHLSGLVGSLDGKVLYRAESTGELQDAQSIGQHVANDLVAQGADKILQELAE